MSKKSVFSRVFGFRSALATVALLALGVLASCDRGASTEIEAARKFSDAVARNDAARRDSMIATERYREYFRNPYVASDQLSWFRTFYDYKEQNFRSTARADVDRNLTKDLEGALLDTTEIEETGMVRVKHPTPGEEPAYFWMVKQRDKPWKVAMVTKGELSVHFK